MRTISENQLEVVIEGTGLHIFNNN